MLRKTFFLKIILVFSIFLFAPQVKAVCVGQHSDCVKSKTEITCEMFEQCQWWSGPVCTGSSVVCEGATFKYSCDELDKMENISCNWIGPTQSTNNDREVDRDGPVTFRNPLGNSEEDADPNVIFGRAVNAVLGISGSLALVMFIYGGFIWMLSGGNSEKANKGKNVLIWSSLGLIVIFSSYAMVNFVFEGLARGAGG